MATTIQRRIRPVKGALSSKIYSETRPGKEVEHEVTIGQDGRVHCTCEHFKYRLSDRNPTVSTPDLWCKHIERYARYLVRNDSRG